MNGYSIILLITAAITASLSYYALRYRKKEGSRIFCLLTLAATLFSLGYAFELESNVLETKLRWVNFEYLGIATIPLFYWIFAVQYVGKGKWLSKKRMLSLCMIPLSILLILCTNPFHHLFYSSAEVKDLGPFSILVLGRGPLFWYHIAYANCFILLAAANFIGFIWTAPRPYRAQASVMLLGSLPPWIVNILYVTGNSPMGIDLSPFGFSLTGVIIAVGLFHYHLLDFVPIALENVFESMKEGALLMDKNQRLVDFNPAAFKIIGTLSKKDIGKPVILNPSEHPELSDLMTKREITQVSFCQSTDNGGLYFQAEKSIIRDKKGFVIGEQILIYDITKQIISEQVLKQNEQKLAKLNVTKDKFFSIIAHDLRGPLGTSNAFLDLLTDENVEFTAEERKHYLLMLKNTSKTTFDLLENLLTWARSQNGQVPFHPQPENLSRLISGNIDLHASVALDKKIRIISNVPDNLEGYFDTNMINTVLRNLLNNAVKYTEEGGTITVSTQKRENMIFVSIRDTGIGMTKKTLENLFSIDLKQISTFGTKGEKGSGIGLEICKEFIEKNGGKIQVESHPGKGSLFSFSVPAQT